MTRPLREMLFEYDRERPRLRVPREERTPAIELEQLERDLIIALLRDVRDSFVRYRAAFTITTEGTPEEHERARELARLHGSRRVT